MRYKIVRVAFVMIALAATGCFGDRLKPVSIDNRTGQDLFFTRTHGGPAALCRAGTVTPLDEGMFFGGTVRLEFAESPYGPVTVVRTFMDTSKYWDGARYVFPIEPAGEVGAGELWLAHSEFREGTRWGVVIERASGGGATQTFEGSHVVGTGDEGRSLLVLQSDDLLMVGPDGKAGVKVALPPELRQLRAAATSEDEALVYAILQDWGIAVLDRRDRSVKVLVAGSDLHKKAHRSIDVSMLTEIHVSGDGKLVVIGLPSDTANDQGSSGEPMMETFQVTLADASAKKLGWGVPRGWLSDGTLVSEGYDARIRGEQSRVWMTKGRTTRTLSGYYRVAVIGGAFYGNTRDAGRWEWSRYDNPVDHPDVRIVVSHTGAGLEQIFGLEK